MPCFPSEWLGGIGLRCGSALAGAATSAVDGRGVTLGSLARNAPLGVWRFWKVSLVGARSTQGDWKRILQSCPSQQRPGVLPIPHQLSAPAATCLASSTGATLWKPHHKWSA